MYKFEHSCFDMKTNKSKDSCSGENLPVLINQGWIIFYCVERGYRRQENRMKALKTHWMDFSGEKGQSSLLMCNPRAEIC